MRRYDCLVFAGELDLLEWRLHELDPVIDYFVIAEATRTFSGNPKPLYYQENQQRYAQYAHKIRYIVVENMPEGPHPGSDHMYDVERIQRDAVMEGLGDASGDDIIIMSDADEIPRREIVPEITTGCYALEQECFYYWLNLSAPNFNPWLGSRIAPFRSFLGQTPQNFRNFPFRTLQRSGWHFSFFGTPEDNARKVQSWSHIEVNRPPMNQPDHFRQCMEYGLDWDIGRGATLQWVAIDDTWPHVVRDRPELVSNYIHR